MNPSARDPEVERLQAAAAWVLRLHESPRDADAVERWLAWCEASPDNLRSYERIRRTWQLAGTATAHPPRHDRDRTGADVVPPMTRRRRRTWRWPALAASLALIALGGWLTLRHLATPDDPVLSTPIAINASSLLPDGSRVDLGAHSRLRLRYGARERRVVIDAGEAYFRVAHDTRRPFVVEAGGLDVIAVGTAFNVHTGADRVLVTVSEGRVRLRPERDVMARIAAAVKPPAEMPALTAGAGEQAAFSSRAGRMRIARGDPAMATAWRSGVLKFVDRPLGEVIADLNRYSSRQIVLDDPTLAGLHYTGTIFTGRLDDWLRAMEQSFPVRARAGDDARVVLVRRAAQ